MNYLSHRRKSTRERLTPHSERQQAEVSEPLNIEHIKPTKKLHHW